MKMREALDIIDGKPRGYMVSFERREGCMLGSGHFPDKYAGEPLIESEWQAWDLARRFAATAPPEYIHICVIGHDFVPLKGYRERGYRFEAL